jgi:hypothetical protein
VECFFHPPSDIENSSLPINSICSDALRAKLIDNIIYQASGPVPKLAILLLLGSKYFGMLGLKKRKKIT